MPDIGHITVGSECIAPRDSVRNLGVQFDSIFSFEEHIKSICKSSFYHLRNIAKIRKYLSQDTCEILVHAFISSKLDHRNSLCRDRAEGGAGGALAPPLFCKNKNKFNKK